MARAPKKRGTTPKSGKDLLKQLLRGPKRPKKALKSLAERVTLSAKVATNPHKIAEARIGKHMKGILQKGAYLKKAEIDGGIKEVLNARTEEEAVDMVNDLVSNFEHSIKNNPDLFEGLTKPIIFNATYKEILIHTTEGGNLYWDIDVVVNGDDVKVVAPLRIVG